MFNTIPWLLKQVHQPVQNSAGKAESVFRWRCYRVDEGTYLWEKQIRDPFEYQKTIEFLYCNPSVLLNAARGHIHATFLDVDTRTPFLFFLIITVKLWDWGGLGGRGTTPFFIRFLYSWLVQILIAPIHIQYIFLEKGKQENGISSQEILGTVFENSHNFKKAN